MLDVALQNDDNLTTPVTPALVEHWITTVLHHNKTPITQGEITIRIIDLDESAALNKAYRSKEGPTNVLSFSYDPQDDFFTGDLAICAPVVEREAREQNKNLMAHWAHMIVHGTLHLMGRDHEIPTDAETMEALEISILTALQFPNPYLE